MTWERRMNKYFMGFCRRVFHWTPGYKAARAASLVGRKAGTEQHRCAECGKVFPRKQTQVDHVEPVVPTTMTGGAMSWDMIRDRMGLLAPVALRVLCRDCHKKITNAQNAVRPHRINGNS